MSIPAGTQAPPDPAAHPTVQTRPLPPWFILAIVVMGVLAGAVAVVALKSSGPKQPPIVAASPTTAPVEANDDSPAPPAAGTSTAAPALASKWVGGVRRSRGRNLAVYELEAGNEVPVWGKVVRPLLTVRCVAGTTEVFVYTQSAAALEGNDGRHTVRVGFDAGADVNERWMASADYDALFAENGVAVARRMSGARTMRFAFTPFNGAPVVARFAVAGFDEIAPKLAQACRWK